MPAGWPRSGQRDDAQLQFEALAGSGQGLRETGATGPGGLRKFTAGWQALGSESPGTAGAG